MTVDEYIDASAQDAQPGVQDADTGLQVDRLALWFAPVTVCLLAWLLGGMTYLFVDGALGRAMALLVILLLPVLWLASNVWRATSFRKPRR